MDCLEEQTLKPTQTLIVDSGSKDTTYLKPYPNVIYEENIGFCRANNLGFSHLKPCDFVFFVNPDLFLTPTYIEEATAFMHQNPRCVALTGALRRYNSDAYDSTGIFQTWYGRWCDRTTFSDKIESVPAICGAAFFCRKEVLDSLPHVFDPTFFMYKEDIDLSLRLRKKGELLFLPHLTAYHCRGWQDRSKIPHQLQLQAVKNELKMHWRNRFILPTLFSLLKYLKIAFLK